MVIVIGNKDYDFEILEFHAKDEGLTKLKNYEWNQNFSALDSTVVSNVKILTIFGKLLNLSPNSFFFTLRIGGVAGRSGTCPYLKSKKNPKFLILTTLFNPETKPVLEILLRLAPLDQWIIKETIRSSIIPQMLHGIKIFISWRKLGQESGIGSGIYLQLGECWMTWFERILMILK